MNPREILEKNYINALEEYQNQVDKINALEEELTDIIANHEDKSVIDEKKKEIKGEYKTLEKLSENITKTYNAAYSNDSSEEVVDEQELLEQKYIEALDAYQKQDDKIKKLEEELTDLIEQKVDEKRIFEQRAEIKEQYRVLEILANNITDAYNAAYSSDVQEDYEDVELKDYIDKEEIRKAIAEAFESIDLSKEEHEEVEEKEEDEIVSKVLTGEEVKTIKDAVEEEFAKIEDEIYSEEDKRIIAELEIDEIRRLQKENERLEIDKQKNIERKEFLMTMDNAKEDSVRGYDEAVRQIDERIALNKREIEYFMKKHPELIIEEKAEQEQDVRLITPEEVQNVIENKMESVKADPVETYKEIEKEYQDKLEYIDNLERGLEMYTEDDNAKKKVYEKQDEYIEGQYIELGQIAEKMTKAFDKIPTDVVKEEPVEEEVVENLIDPESVKDAIDKVFEELAKEEETKQQEQTDEIKEEITEEEIVEEKEEKQLPAVVIKDTIDEALRQLEEQEEVNATTESAEIQEIKDLISEKDELVSERKEVEKEKAQELNNEQKDAGTIKELEEQALALNKEINEINKKISELKEKHPEYVEEEEIKEVIDEAMDAVSIEEQTRKAIEEAVEKTDELNREVEEEKQSSYTLDEEEIRKAVEEALAKIELENRDKAIVPPVTTAENDNIVEAQDEDLTIIPIDAEEIVDIPEGYEVEEKYELILKGSYTTNDPYATNEEKKNKILEIIKKYGYELTPAEKEKLRIGVEDKDLFDGKVKFVVYKPVKRLTKKIEIIKTDPVIYPALATDEVIKRIASGSYKSVAVEEIVKETIDEAMEDVELDEVVTEDEVTTQQEEVVENKEELEISQKYINMLHPEYGDIESFDKDKQRALLIDYWYIRENYKDIDNLFGKMKKYYKNAKIDDRSLLISILPKYVIQSEIKRRKKNNELPISEKEYKKAVYRALDRKDRIVPDWAYTETMLMEISNVNGRKITEEQNKQYEQTRVSRRENIPSLKTLEEAKKEIVDVLDSYTDKYTNKDEAISNLANIFRTNLKSIEERLSYEENGEELKAAMRKIISDRNSLYEMCGILLGEITTFDDTNYVNKQAAEILIYKSQRVFDELATFLMSTLLIQQTESQIMVDDKVESYINLYQNVRTR